MTSFDHAAPLTVAPPPERFNFADHLLSLNAERGDKAAYIDRFETLSYGELARRVRQCAGALQAMGVRREERVFLLMHDGTDWPVAFLGCLYAGAVPVALNTLLTANDYAYMLGHSRARLALVSDGLLPVLEQALTLAQGERDLQAVVVSRSTQTASASAQGLPLHRFDAWLQAAAAATTPAATLADDIGFWLYSSGSTGRPKGTVHRHASLYWTAELYGKPVLGLTERDVCFSAAKLFFAYGLGNGLSFPLSVGATVVLLADRPTPDAVFGIWTQHQPTVFFGAPTGYAGMLASPNLPSRQQVSLRLCSSAGEALPREVGERFTAHFGCRIVDGIGSTEMLHIFLSNTPDDVRYGTTGKPVPGYQLELRDDHGVPIERSDEVGDLYIQGPSAALMYWNNRQKSVDTFLGPWTRSGDKYLRDRDGYYIYAGRSDDMLKVSGQYVSPFEVESTLMQHDAVLEAAVIGVNDSDGLTRAKAFVVLKPQAHPGADALPALAASLQAFVKSRLAPHKYPRNLSFVDELPKTATGKIQRFKLRDAERGSEARN